MEHNVEEKILTPKSGAAVLIANILLMLASIGIFALGMYYFATLATITTIGRGAIGLVLACFGIILFIVSCILFSGLKILEPKEALVLTLFGKYYGTIKKEGFYFVNPFCGAVNPVVKTVGKLEIESGAAHAPAQAIPTGKKKISLKTMTLNNEKQKVNDILGNPVIIGSIVIWEVENPTKAVFNVENYWEFLSIQCDSVIRNVARSYPYDAPEDDLDEKSLRGSSQEVADLMREELQKRVKDAGIKILEVKITNLSYAEEIAAAMLQKQQAVAVIAARKKIVEGAVGMVNMAIEQLSEQEVVELDEERKAQMVSNLLVVLCGNKDAQPIVNSGSIY
jgi:regulator of protease activity HflC (stomatin/prohibitin superfamily)